MCICHLNCIKKFQEPFTRQSIVLNRNSKAPSLKAGYSARDTVIHTYNTAVCSTNVVPIVGVLNAASHNLVFYAQSTITVTSGRLC